MVSRVVSCLMREALAMAWFSRGSAARFSVAWSFVRNGKCEWFRGQRVAR